MLLIKTSEVDIVSRLLWRTVVKMHLPIVSIEGNIGARKTTLLQKFKQSLSSDNKVTIKVEHEPIKEFQSFHGNDLINPLEHLYKNPTDNAFIFQNYVLDVYQLRMETVETVQHPARLLSWIMVLKPARYLPPWTGINTQSLDFYIWLKSTYDLNLKPFQANFMLPIESLI